MGTTEPAPAFLTATGRAVFASVGGHGGVTLDLSASDGTSLRFVGRSRSPGPGAGLTTGRAALLVPKAALIGPSAFAVEAVTGEGGEGVVITFTRDGKRIGQFTGAGSGTVGSLEGTGLWSVPAPGG